MKDKIRELIFNIVNKYGIDDISLVEISIPNIKEMGDYSTNIAMKLTKILNRAPIEIAELIKNDINSDDIEKVEVAAPGFINFFVNKKYLFDNIINVLENNKSYGSNNIGSGKKINIEFVSANPTGFLHLGNARGGAYGDNLARILAFSGYGVNKEYYVNDRGNQVNNLGLSLQARYFEVCGKEWVIPEDGYNGEDIKILANELYEKYNNKLLEEDLNFFIQFGVDRLLKKILADLEEYGIVYDKITSEKQVVEKGYIENILKLYKEKGYTYESNGALWFKGTTFGAPRDFVLVKSDGKETYLLPDIAHHIDTMQNKYNKLINILGADHHGYVPAITSTVSAAGYPDLIDIKLLQLVKLIKNGQEVKMSKRTGNTITLKELIDEVGVNAARYFFAARSLDTQMDFNIDIAQKQTNENPVYYICYAYARICSILKDNDNDILVKEYKSLNSSEAYNVLEKVYAFPEVVISAAQKEMPHLIANYVYELAALFHAFYSKHRVIVDDVDEKNEKICMIKAVKITLENALNLIGINPPKEM